MKLNRKNPDNKIALAYLAFGFVWILGTDYLLNLYGKLHPASVAQIQGLKGILFVLASSFFIWLLSHRYFKKQTALLEQSELQAGRYRALYESIIDGVIEYDFSTDKATLNAKLMLDLGYETEVVDDFYARHVARIHPDDRDRVAQKMQQATAQQKASWQLEYRYLWKDGTYHNVLSRGYFQSNAASGAVERYAGTFHDLSEVKTIQTKLSALELHYNRQLSRESFRAQDTERERLAMELHDNIGQLLTVAKLYTDHLATEVNNPLVGKVHGILHDTLTEVRQLSFAMKQPRFSEVAFDEAINMLVSRIRAASGLRIQVDYPQGEEQLLQEEHKIIVYRIIQEQLTNIVKHAQAKAVRIGLRVASPLVTVEVADDGIGFSGGQAPAGIGLQNIRNRVESYKGFLNISAQPQRGCTLTASFSLS